MQPEDEDHLRQLLKACDEMLTHHERTGNSETEPAKQIAAKRRELLNRRNQSPDTPSSGQATYTFLLTLANGEPADPAVFVSDVRHTSEAKASSPATAAARASSR
jgi:hypothetical protein